VKAVHRMLGTPRRRSPRPLCRPVRRRSVRRPVGRRRAHRARISWTVCGL